MSAFAERTNKRAGEAPRSQHRRPRTEARNIPALAELEASGEDGYRESYEVTDEAQLEAFQESVGQPGEPTDRAGYGSAEAKSRIAARKRSA